MADPALAAAVSPRPDEPPFDLHGFATSQDTLYMIAQGQDEHSPMAGLFACLASEIHHAAGMAGSFADTGRLPRPMLLALDEVCQLCPVPLASWMADSGGKGIQVVAVGHGEAQFRAKFGASSARQIFDCAGLLAVLPGVTDPETLRSVSQAVRVNPDAAPRQRQLHVGARDGRGDGPPAAARPCAAAAEQPLAGHHPGRPRLGRPAVQAA